MPLNARSRFPLGYTVLYGDEGDAQWQPDAIPDVFAVEYGWRVGKVGLDSPAGWLAFHHPERNAVFCLLFPYEAGRADDYPDGGCSVECWASGEGVAAGVDWGERRLYHLEAEVLSPVHTLNPGQSGTQFPLVWAYCVCPAPIVRAGEAGVVSRPLAWEAGHVSGTFGVFHRGPVWLRPDSDSARDVPLGAADPNAPLIVRAKLPDAPRRVELLIEDGAGQEHVLDTWDGRSGGQNG